YFATSGYDISYNAEFANIIGNMNLGIEGKFTSPNFSSNFFGFGNSTPNFDDDLGLDYNRVKLRTIKMSPSLIWRGISGASFKTTISYESVEVEETEGRFINNFLNTNDGINQAFFGGEVTYQYENYDNKAFPTLGMMTSLKAGFKMNEKDLDKGFVYLIPEIGFDTKLVTNGRLVLATKLKAHLNFGDDFEFYQAANIGANNGLRGYRNERFTGKNAFYQKTDLRFNFRKIKTGLLPLQIGLYGGFDYGRVWVDNDLVSNLDYNSETWNTSIGGGIFVNAADMITGNLSLFNSDDGLLIAFTFGFGF
ncbi:MAG: BamA/TamA family outer membrane protein, partial [Aureibaculum sp.]